MKRYIGKSNANQGRVTIEYVLLDHVNDSTDDAHELAALLKETPCKINLIPGTPSRARLMAVAPTAASIVSPKS